MNMRLSSLRWYGQIALLATVISVLVGGSYLSLKYFTSLNIRPRLTTISIITSSLLTFSLITLYWKQVDAQKDMIEAQKQQKEIASNQEALMEKQSAIQAAAYEPEVIHGDFSAEKLPHGHDIEFRINLRNVGENTAKHFRLMIEFTPTDTDKEYGLEEFPLRKEGSPIKGYYHTVLAPNEESCFIADIGVHRRGGNGEFETRVFYQYQGRLDMEVYQRALGTKTLQIEDDTDHTEIIFEVLGERL